MIWDEPPGDDPWRQPPSTVLRCDDELVDLVCSAQAVEVHEAWIDQGPRRRSKPRWVLADRGVAVPHRRAWFAHLYLRAIARRPVVGSPTRLGLEMPPVGLGVLVRAGDEPRSRIGWRDVGWRAACLGLVSLAMLRVG